MTATPGSSHVPDAQAAITSLTKYQAPGANSDWTERARSSDGVPASPTTAVPTSPSSTSASWSASRSASRIADAAASAPTASTFDGPPRPKAISNVSSDSTAARVLVAPPSIPATCRRPVAREPSRSAPGMVIRLGNMGRRIVSPPVVGTGVTRALATMVRRMTPEEKPYRLYRGGRVKGKVPSVEPKRTGPRPPRIRLRPSRRWWKLLPALLAVFLILVIVWALASYFQFRDGVSAANKRLSPRVE